MRKMLSYLTAGAFAVCTVAGFTAAKADVAHVAIVVADNKADYDNNAALLATFSELFKKGNAKFECVASDEAKMTITIISVWTFQTDEGPY